MPNGKCQALTASGKPCKLKAGPSGYCHIHDTDRIAEREAARRLSEKQHETKRWRRFSERRGIRPVSEIIQVDGMNDDLRNSIWNVLNYYVLSRYKGHYVAMEFLRDGHDEFTYRLWADFFKKPVDLIPSSAEGTLRELFRWFSSCEWYEAYDFLEYLLNYVARKDLNAAVNKVLGLELSGYRFVGSVITAITDEQEVDMLGDALADQDFPSVRAHLQRALELLSDRNNPDYRNSIKESISAVESLARVITGKPKSTLGEALKTLERSGRIHPTLKEAFSKMYGYTSDEGGIRHAMLGEPDLSAADARFFLLSCTSFINYLKSRL